MGSVLRELASAAKHGSTASLARLETQGRQKRQLKVAAERVPIDGVYHDNTSGIKRTFTDQVTPTEQRLLFEAR